MASILEVPREIRDSCLAYALRVQRTPPASPAELHKDDAQHGVLKHNRNSRLTNSTNDLVRFERRPYMSASLALCLVNRQLHDEVKEIMRREARARPNYHLDLMYLTDGSIWSTWASIPILSQRIDTVYTTFRLFDCPAELETLRNGKPYRIFRGGDGGPPSVVWLFYHVLEAYLKQGPWPHDDFHVEEGDAAATAGEEERCHAGMIMQSLVINVLTPTGPGILPLEYPSFRSPGRASEANFFSRFTKHDEDLKTQSDGVQAAAQFIRFIKNQLGSLAGVGYYHESYGRFLYDRIGTIDIQLDGVSQSFIDLAKFPDRDYFGSPWSHERGSKGYAEWIVTATKTRKSLGLPVAPLSPYLQTFIAEKGLRLESS